MQNDFSRMKIVGISDWAVTQDSACTLVTFSLGSCLGVALLDPVARVGGMIHCLLPFSSMDPSKAEEKPAMFVDIGIDLLLQEMFDLGAERGRMICKLAGCGDLANIDERFRIGEKNYNEAGVVLFKHGIRVSGECVGGSDAKTLYLEMATGKAFVKTAERMIQI